MDNNVLSTVSLVTGEADWMRFYCPGPARSLRFTRRGELLDSAFRPIVRAIGLLRTDRIVVSRPRLEVVQAHAENCRGVVRVQRDRRFRSLAQVIGIGTIVHDTVMLGRSSGVVSGPPESHAAACL